MLRQVARSLIKQQHTMEITKELWGKTSCGKEIFLYTLKNKGIQHVNSKGRGDLYFRVIVDVPKNLSETQKQMLRDFEKSCATFNNTQKESFSEKLKQFFNKS